MECIDINSTVWSALSPRNDVYIHWICESKFILRKSNCRLPFILTWWENVVNLHIV